MFVIHESIMLASKYIPTRLISPSERPTIPISPLQEVSRFRPFIILMVLIKLIADIFWLILTRKRDRTKHIRRVRQVLEDLGPLWMKAGQLLSLRADLFSADVCQELSRIQDTGDGIPFEQVRHIIEQELERPLESVFEHFANTPFVSTSLAQLHRAYFRPQNIWVVVKVKKPHADQIFVQDMRLIRMVAWLLKACSIYPNMRWEDLEIQLQDLITKELDFRFEVASLQRLKKKLRRHNIYVPNTFPAYSTPRVLVMEFIHGALMSDVVDLKHKAPDRLDAWFKENQIDSRRIVRRVFDSVYRQIFEDNYFHGDMHPGNIVLLRNNRLATLDCRSVGSLERELLTKYRLFLQAVVKKQHGVAADIYFLLTDSLPVVDISKVKAALMRAWRLWETKTHIKELPYHEKSITSMFDELNKIVFKYQFAAQWSLSKVIRAWANLDASLLHLRPEMDYLKYLQRYFQRANQRLLNKDIRHIPERIPQSINAIQKSSLQVSEFALFQQNILRRRAQVMQGKTTKSGAVIAALLGCLGQALLLIEGVFVFTFLDQSFAYPVQQIIGNQLIGLIRTLPVLSSEAWLAAIGIGLFAILLTRKVRKRISQVEVMLPDISASV